MDALSSSFKRDLHVRFLQMMMENLPLEYELQDINRLTLAYFVISGLDILGVMGSVRLLKFPIFTSLSKFRTNQETLRYKNCVSIGEIFLSWRSIAVFVPIYPISSTSPFFRRKLYILIT